MLVPRGVKFLNGIAVAVEPAICEHDKVEVIFLPTDHYDFVGYNVKGKTKQQILEEITYMNLPTYLLL